MGGGLLAGMLNWPQAGNASKVEVTEDKKTVDVEREIDEGIQVLKMPLPAIITADLRLNDPRFATLPNLMKAKKKPMEVVDAASLDVDLSPRAEMIQVVEPPP